ncbi:MAG: FliM/FliN family flagellar motor switch protein [Planctomycetota bacterium]
MSELLSSAEIDTLMQLFREDSAGESEVGASLPERVRPVDLLKPNRFGRDELDAFERFLTGAAAGIGSSLSEKLRLDLFCDCVSVEQLRFSDWQAQGAGMSALYALQIGDDDSALLSVDGELVHGLVDRLLGGRGVVDPTIDGLTEACLTAADVVIETTVERLRSSLAEILPITMHCDRRLHSHSSARIVGRNDVVLSLLFAVSSEWFSGNLRFAMPFAAIEPLLTQMQHGGTPDYDAHPGSQQDAVESSLRDVRLDLRAVLDRLDLRVEDLLDLEVGDVLPLDRRVGSRISVEVAGRSKFSGDLGNQGSRRGIRIADCVESEVVRPQEQTTS